MCLHKSRDSVSPLLEYIILSQSGNVPRFLSEPGPEEGIIFGIADLVQVYSTEVIAAEYNLILDFYRV